MLLKPSKKINGRIPFTPNNFYFTFQQFLITWLNIITKERRLYPEEAFEYRNSFNIRVPYNRHPKVQEWQNNLVKDLMNDLVFQNTRQVKVIIYDEYSGHIAETYTINVGEFLHVSTDFYDKEIKDLKTDWKTVNDEFRSNLYTLLTEIRKLPPLNPPEPESSLEPTPGIYLWKYNILLETEKVSMNTNWVLDKRDVKHSKRGIDKSGDKNDAALNIDVSDDDDVDDKNLIPLQVVDIGPIVFYSSIELTHP